MSNLVKRCRRRGSERCALGANGAPNARAETGGPATGPGSTAPKWAEPSAPMGGAGPRHGVHLGSPRGRNAAAQPDWVKRERSAGRKNAAVAYSKADLDGSAMAAGSGGDHAPVSIELGRTCRRRRTRDCGSGRQDDGARTIANHGRPHFAGVGLGLISKHNSRRRTHREGHPLAKDDLVASFPCGTILVISHIALLTLSKRGACEEILDKQKSRQIHQLSGPLYRLN
jgi:hypothetical protein